jgi:hypothetical protein
MNCCGENDSKNDAKKQTKNKVTIQNFQVVEIFIQVFKSFQVNFLIFDFQLDIF